MRSIPCATVPLEPLNSPPDGRIALIVHNARSRDPFNNLGLKIFPWIISLYDVKDGVPEPVGSSSDPAVELARHDKISFVFLVELSEAQRNALDQKMSAHGLQLIDTPLQ